VKYEIVGTNPIEKDEPIKLWLELSEEDVHLFASKGGVKAYVCTLCADGTLCLPYNEGWLTAVGLQVGDGHIRNW
jgi:hypothetical protein